MLELQKYKIVLGYVHTFDRLDALHRAPHLLESLLECLDPLVILLETDHLPLLDLGAGDADVRANRGRDLLLIVREASAAGG